MDYLEELQAAIARLHQCESRHIETVPVTEVFKGQTAWEGMVEVFELTGHAKTKRCYAWGYPDKNKGGRLEVVTVLEIPPVNSPQTAVKIAIAAQARSRNR